MATAAQYDAAKARVLGGNPKPGDVELVEREARQAGSRGSQAREALKKAR